MVNSADPSSALSYKTSASNQPIPCTVFTDNVTPSISDNGEVCTSSIFFLQSLVELLSGKPINNINYVASKLNVDINLVYRYTVILELFPHNNLELYL